MLSKSTGTGGTCAIQPRDPATREEYEEVPFWKTSPTTGKPKRNHKKARRKRIQTSRRINR